jgi:TolB-like protein/Tfp pilus assembly protein PilF
VTVSALSPEVLHNARAFQVTRIKVECCRDERFVKARRVNPKNFFAELKRRNVYKVAIAYAVVAWLLMQIATQVFPFLEIPNWAIRLVIMLIVIGFPIALVIAWAFELTPEGLKRTESADELAKKPVRKRVWLYVVVVAGAISISLFFIGRYTASSKQSGLTELPAKSIAVLPFENLSEEKANSYFADGIQEEILTRLSKIADLKVISRTSTQKYKSAPNNLREIAQQLGVANILEGSVQKAGDEVRITVQLINALSDSHLWAETYDRKLIDTFGIESDVAQKIASSLEAKLTGSEKRAIAARPTDNKEAYQLYLKGRFFWNKRTGDDLKTALDYFNQAIAADPKYAVAYAGQADACLLIPMFSTAEPQEYFARAKAAARRAIEFDETSAEGHTALANLLCVDDLKFAESEKEFKRAIELNPNYATARHWFGNNLLVSLGRFDDAVREAKRAVELDPLSLSINADLGSTLILARRYDEAIEQLRRTIALDSKFSYAHWNLGLALNLKGDLTAALVEYEKARALDASPDVLALLGRAYAEAGRKEQALEILRELNETAQHHFVRAYLFALISIGLGEKSTAIQYLEQSYQHHENLDLSWVKVDPLLDPLRGDPRFEALVAKIFPSKESPRTP